MSNKADNTDTQTNNTPTHLVLGPYLDQLLNSECKLFEHKDFTRSVGGIKRPTPSSLGTGNIIIRGKAGTCKTTLALQIAVEAVRRNNGVYAAYIAFEEDASQLFEKATHFDWGRYVHPLNQMPDSPGQYNTSVEDFANDLEKSLNEPMLCRVTGEKPKTDRRDNSCDARCPYKEYCRQTKEYETIIPEYTFFPGKVILPRLEPVVLTNTNRSEIEDLFWKRYEQIEVLLKAAKELRDRKCNKKQIQIEAMAKLVKIKTAITDKIKEAKKEISKLRLHKQKHKNVDTRRDILNTINTYIGKIEEAIDDKNATKDTIDVIGFIGDLIRQNPTPMKIEAQILVELKKQLEKLESPDLALVCIDSLNVFGSSRGLTRDHLEALFDLFRRYKTIGLFVVEENDNGTFSGDNPIACETIDFLADTVIELTAGQESGYFIRHFQVLKSRTQSSISGRHPFKNEGVPEHLVQTCLAYTARNDGASENSEDKSELLYHTDIAEAFIGNNNRNFANADWKETKFKKSIETRVEALFKDYKDTKWLKTDQGKEFQAQLTEKLAEHFYVKLFRESLERHRRGESWTGIRVHPSVHYIIRQSSSLLLTKKSNDEYDQQEGEWESFFKAKLLPMMSTKKAVADIAETAYKELKDEQKYSSFIEGKIINKWAFWEGETEVTKTLTWSSLDDFNKKVIKDNSLGGNASVAVIGPEMAGKSFVAGSFLWQGLNEGSDVLLIRFAETADFEIKNCRMWEKDKEPKPPSECTLLATEHGIFEWARKYGEDIHPAVQALRHLLLSVNLHIGFSVQAVTWTEDDKKTMNWMTKKKNQKDSPLFIELAIKTSAVQPEYLVKVVRMIYHWGQQYRPNTIRRAGLFQIETIGVSYPLLYNSPTASGLFLPALAHVFRYWGTPFVMTAETGGVAQAEEMVDKAKSLAAQTVTSKYQDVFGDRYVTVTGPGAAEWEPNAPSSVTPAVFMQTKDRKAFWLDFELLEGLVGFSTGNIRRPGVMLQFFQGGTLHKKYNEHVKRLVGFALGATTNPRLALNEPLPHVELKAFDSKDADSFHDSFSLLPTGPLHNTVIRTVDEFEVTGHLTGNFEFQDPTLADRIKAGERHFVQKLLRDHSVYYRNVLVCACDTETHEKIGKISKKDAISFWKKLKKDVIGNGKKPKVKVFYDLQAAETLNCLLMDGIVDLSSPPEVSGMIDFSGIDDKIKTSLAKYLDSIRDVLRPANSLPPDQAERKKRLTELISSQGNGRYIIFAWYSQLREILALAKEQKDAKFKLSQMMLHPFPGRGFVGDWYLQIPETSVSRSLGERVKDQLLSHTEDFRRYIEGVGLPCWAESITFPAFSQLPDFKFTGEKRTKYESIYKTITDFLNTPANPPKTGLLKSTQKPKPFEQRFVVFEKAVNSLYDLLEPEKLEVSPEAKKLFDMLAHFKQNKDIWNKILERREKRGKDFDVLKDTAAWPNAENVNLTRVKTIHDDAKKRSDIIGYNDMRRFLIVIMRNLCQGSLEPDTTETAKFIISVLKNCALEAKKRMRKRTSP